VSVNPQLKLGVGGYLLVSLSFLEKDALSIKRDDVSTRVKINHFTETSSTKLELQTILWALEHIREELTESNTGGLQIYTDSQCVAGLMGRRKRLEHSGFISKRSGQPLPNAPLYRSFFAAQDQLGFQVMQLPGHSPAGSHSTIQRIFSYVDRDVRKTLSDWMHSINSPHTHPLD